jgi:two-component system cell cycle sensor histidine kinase/response regulator CckA
MSSPMTRSRLGPGGAPLDSFDSETGSGQPWSSAQDLDESLPFFSGVLYRCAADPSRALWAVAGRFEELTGVHRAEIDGGLGWSDLIHPEDRQAAWESVASAIRAGHPFCVEYRVLTREGDERWVLDQGTCLRHPNGDPAALAGALVDVTLTRRLEEQAARAGAIGRLAAGVAHDINNLQAVITSCAQLISRVVPTDPGTRDRLDEIIDAARRAATLARHLVAFTRPGTAEAVPMDLNQLIAGMERLLRSLLGREIALELCLGTALGTVTAEPSELEQILLNLVANAKEALPDGGSVTISTVNLTESNDDAVPHAGLQRDAYVRLRVEDTGTGIAPETLLRVFEPYFSTKESSGLGLSTVEAIVRRQGGHVQVTSLVGRGTVFDVLLPRSDQPRRSAISRVISRRPQAASPLALIVARDQSRCSELGAELGPLDLRSLTATSAREALELTERHAADLVAVVIEADLAGAPELGQDLNRLCPNAAWVLVGDQPGALPIAETGRLVVVGRPLAPGAISSAIRSLRPDLAAEPDP